MKKEAVLFIAMVAVSIAFAQYSNCPDTDGDWDLAVNYTINSSITCNVINIPASVILAVDSSVPMSQISINAVNITVNGTISADGTGYPKQQGPGYAGGPISDVAAGHGGEGGGQSGYFGGIIYGDFLEPTTLGSGSHRYDGGGSIKLNVSDTLDIDGKVTANGMTDSVTHFGGSAGGSIWVITVTLKGSGVFEAKGGNGQSLYSSGGGGGRIAVYYDSSTFSGITSSSVAGGNCPRAECGEPGSIAFIDQTDNSIYLVDGFEFKTDESPFSYNKIYLLNDVWARGDSLVRSDQVIFNNTEVTCDRSNQNQTKNITLSSDPAYSPSELSFNSSLFTTVGVLEVSCDYLKIVEDTAGNSMLSDKDVLYSDNLMITNAQNNLDLHNADIELISNNQAGISLSGNIVFLDMVNTTLQGNLVHDFDGVSIDSDSVLSADGAGYLRQQGPGYSSAAPEVGAGHGGKGGDYVASPGGATYDSSLEPTEFGSGSYQYSGGGAIKLDVSGTFDLDGKVTANGMTDAAGHRGGSAGGSIWVVAGTLGGSGSFEAKGGNGQSLYSSGGGGGRIAVYYDSSTFSGIDSSSVVGGSGPRADNGEVGTLIVIDVDDDTALMRYGFEFQDSLFEYDNITASDAILRINSSVSSLNITACDTLRLVDSDLDDPDNKSLSFKANDYFSNSTVDMGESGSIDIAYTVKSDGSAIYDPAPSYVQTDISCDSGEQGVIPEFNSMQLFALVIIVFLVLAFVLVKD